MTRPAPVDQTPLSWTSWTDPVTVSSPPTASASTWSRPGIRAAGPAGARVPRVVVLVAPPVAGARRGRVPGRRHRRAGYGRSSRRSRSRPTGCSTTSTTTSAWSRPSARKRRSSSATTGGRPSPPTPPCCGPTCSEPSPCSACRTARPAVRRPTEAFAEMGGDEEFYIQYFQEPGRAEAEIELDVRSWLRGFYVGASGDAVRPADGGTMATVAPGRDDAGSLRHARSTAALADGSRPRLLRREFERTGFSGPLNRYRNVDRDWADLQPWAGRPSPCRRCLSAASGRPDHLGPAVIERFPRPCRRSRQPHPARLRPLGAAGAAGPGGRTLHPRGSRFLG